MRVLIFGGRDYDDRAQFYRSLRKFELRVGEITFVIQGKAKGADSFAEEWADVMKIPQRGFRADWSRYDKAAGGIRNKQMIDEGKPDAAIGFPGGPGTANMTRQIKEYNQTHKKKIRLYLIGAKNGKGN